MAKQYGGIFANWYGRVGNVVGRIRQGRTIMSIYQPNVANPRTPAQLAQREKFSLLADFLSAVSGFLSVGFHNLDGYETGNYYSSAIGYNMKRDNVFVGQYPSTELDLTKVMISNGKVDLPYTPQCTADGTTLNLTWADNSGMGDAVASDKVMVCAYNDDKKQSVFSLDVADRSERHGELALPTAWTGDTVNVYMAMYRDRGVCSDSYHLAVLSL